MNSHFKVGQSDRVRLPYFFAALTITLLLASSVVSQTKDADKEASDRIFDGTWLLNKKESVDEPGDLRSWKIVSASRSISIESTSADGKGEFSSTLALFTDNSGEVNEVPDPISKQRMRQTSRTFWKKDTLVRKYQTGTSNIQVRGDVTDEYRLSKDGKRLTYTSVMVIPGYVPPRYTKLVFDKVDWKPIELH